ncbi:MAG: hypothetical protein AB1480_12485 [Nitrospirota bacterium]
MRIKEFFITDARESPGSVYRVEDGREAISYKRRGGNIYSIAFLRGRLYFVNANEDKVYRVVGRRSERAVYTHSTYIRDIALDRRDNIYFSEASGAGGDGSIYRLNMIRRTATLFLEVRIAEVGGFWAGNFAFDKEDNLYLSSGNRIPAGIYRLRDGRWEEIFRDEREPIKGLTFLSCDLLCYTNWRSEIYMLDIYSGLRSLLYSNPAHAWLSDITFITPRTEEDTLYEGTKDYTCDSVCWRDDGTVDNRWNLFFPDIDAENDNIRSLLGSIGLPTEPTTDNNEIWRRVKVAWSWLNDHVLREGHPNYDAAHSYLESLDHWPSISELAYMFFTYGGIVWGTCMSRSQALATLLYRVEIPPDRMAIAEARWRPEYSQHMYIVLKIGCHWYHIDPTCIDSHPVLSDSPENVGCLPADYTHPNSLRLLPDSTLSKPMLVR